MPVVDGRVELQAGIGRRPGGVGDLLPQSAAFTVLASLPGLVRQVRSQSPSASTALRNSLVTRTVLLEFWPETVR